MIILHCADKNKWEEDKKLGTYGVSEISKKGYIACMRPESITSDNFTFPSTKEYVILCIDTDKVDTEIHYEDEIKIYGTLPAEAVINTLAYTFDNDDKFFITKEIVDLAIINNVLENMNLNYESYKYFSDGTYSRIILLNNKYIIKQNDISLLKSEAMFSEWYKSPKLQNVVYSDKDFKFIVYQFVPGDVMHTIDDFNDVVSNIKAIVNLYKNYDGPEFGYIYAPSNSWEEFLKTSVNDHSLTLPDSFNYLPKVYDAIETLSNYPFDKKLIHGDFGTHNFIKKNGKFVAAIDPIPLAGDTLYDMIYALLSNIDFLPHLSTDFISEISGEPKEKVKAMLTVVLFCRLDTCLKHHKEDIDDYLDFWYKIVE